MTQVIVALDVDTILKEEELLKSLKGTITHFKVGLKLFTAHGKRAVDLVHQSGGKVFLDLKFLDIPQTVADAVREAQRLGVDAVSVHLWGGTEMIKAATQVQPRPRIWGVTVLTSMVGKDVKVLHPHATLATLVKNLAKMGWVNGIDGTICSGQEVADLRKSLSHLDMRFVVPGIRPAGGAAHDQRRTMTPGEAAKLGIDYIVVGRPITMAPNPLKAAHDILREMQAAAPSSLEAT
ncbi:MAG: orotidine-5'-phosphate decarboxylase [Elusimicrobia bacterium]|nr:orotidine-5'-phosphate decarboxylase [Elusimicrobiota bacterium]